MTTKLLKICSYEFFPTFNVILKYRSYLKMVNFMILYYTQLLQSLKLPIWCRKVLS